MFKSVFMTGLLLVVALLFPSAASATVVFDFDDVQPTPRKTPGGLQVELYMEALYGSNVSVSPNTSAAHGPSIYKSAYQSSDSENAFLTLGKGKGLPAIVIHFDDNPIDSFSVDFKLFKKAKGFSIFADGKLISLDALSKAQKKTGLSGQKTFYFDNPIHELTFTGGKKNSFAIDNLVVDLPGDGDSEEDLPSESNENGSGPGLNFIETSETNREFETQSTAVPEPTSLLLLAFGFAAVRLRSFFANRSS